jgi:hypothetical protein
MTLLEMQSITSRFSRLGVRVKGYYIGGQPVLVGIMRDTGALVYLSDGATMEDAGENMRQWADQVYGEMLEREAQDWRAV